MSTSVDHHPPYRVTWNGHTWTVTDGRGTTRYQSPIGSTGQCWDWIADQHANECDRIAAAFDASAARHRARAATLTDEPRNAALCAVNNAESAAHCSRQRAASYRSGRMRTYHRRVHESVQRAVARDLAVAL
ncbi:MAG: hypothetical protein M0P31_14025 [Solirubrobacteraceae bacterium]|nr:hypothetical protein [Solirubrobacteraceae bacterium]